jgi:hypothetical protein
MAMDVAAQLDQVRQELLQLGFKSKIRPGGAASRGRRERQPVSGTVVEV